MLRDPKSGPFNVADFQVSALPWVTSSTVTGVKKHTFPKITSFLLIKNNSDFDFDFAFTLNGFESSHYLTLAANESLSTELRLRTLYLSSSVPDQTYMILAGLTSIDSHHMPNLTGSSFATGSSNQTYWEGVG